MCILMESRTKDLYLLQYPCLYTKPIVSNYFQTAFISPRQLLQNYRLQNQHAIILKSIAFAQTLKTYLLNRCVLVILLCILWIVAIDILRADVVIDWWVFHTPLPFTLAAWCSFLSMGMMLVLRINMSFTAWVACAAATSATCCKKQ